MTFQIGIEVDNNRIAWVQNSERAGSVLTKLTTLTEEQSAALIKFYIKTPKGKFPIHSETVNRLNREQTALPSIDVRTAIENRSVHFRINLNNRGIKEGDINIRKYTRSKFPLLFILAAVAVLAAAAVFLLLPLIESPNPEKPQQVQQEVKQEPSKPVATQTESEPSNPEQPSEPEAPETETTAETEAAAVEVKETPIEVESGPVVSWSESEIWDKHSVYFSPDSPALTSEAISMLKSFISSLPADEDFEEGYFELAVRGHCAKYGTEEGRADLSRERAFNVTDYLRSRWGIEADYTTSGAGASEPVSLKRDEQHLNRRVDIEIKGSIKKKIVTQQ